MPERCQGSSYNCSGKTKSITAYTFPLDYIKYDFYKKSPDFLVVQVYVKEIDQNSLDVTFEENSLHVRFKTSSEQFLTLHQDTSKETIFEWHVKLRHGIDRHCSKYTISKSKLTLMVKRGKAKDQWNSFEALNSEEFAVGKNLANGGTVEISDTSGSASSPKQNSGNEHNCRGVQNQENIAKYKENNTSDSMLAIDNSSGKTINEQIDPTIFSGDKVVNKEDIPSRLNGGDKVGNGENDFMIRNSDKVVNKEDIPSNLNVDKIENGENDSTIPNSDKVVNKENIPSDLNGGDKVENGEKDFTIPNSEKVVNKEDIPDSLRGDKVVNKEDNSSSFGVDKVENGENYPVSLSGDKLLNGEDSFTGHSDVKLGDERTIPTKLSGNKVVNEENNPSSNQASESNISMANNDSISESENCKSKDRTKPDNDICNNDPAEKVTNEPLNTITDHGFCGKTDILRQQNVAKLPSSELQPSIEDNCSRMNSQCSHLKDISSDKSTTSADHCSSKSLITNNVEDRTDKDFKLCYDAKVHNCRPGSTGLVNHGNLCYINSIVQCLSAVRELRAYFLGKKHSVNINSKNKAGFEGHLASSFSSLIQELWSGRERCVSASKLKEILGRKHKHFTHLGQGDAQEFLTFLLDGLHEDLKNARKKLIGVQEAGIPKDIMENGLKHWEKFIDGNHSIIIDIFHGQTVSEIRCKSCDEPSLRFDPWMQLNLPIPNDPQYLSIYVFFLDPSKKPLQVKLKVCRGSRCCDLLMQISKLVAVPARYIVLLRSYCSRIAHIYDPMEELSYSNPKEHLIACQLVARKQDNKFDKEKHGDYLPENNANPQIVDNSKMSSGDTEEGNQEVDNNCRILHISVIQRETHRIVVKCSFCSIKKVPLNYCSKCCRAAYCNSECQKKHWKSHRPFCQFQPIVIGFPFILSIPYSQATLKEIEKTALQYARFSVAPKKGELENRQFHLTLLDNLTDFHSKGKKLNEKGDSPVVDDNVCLALDWNDTKPDQKVLSKQLDCEIHGSVKNVLSAKDNSCSLEECLKLYWNPETMSEKTGWRCDHCKNVRPATRKMMIFRNPKTLIIHIKRFSYSGNGRKIRKHVHFPLRGLDMSPFTYDELCADEAIYDLRAVCSHHGFMNYGHYVTYSKPYSRDELDAFDLASTEGWLRYDDSRVTIVSESTVKKAEAYILLYERRDENYSTLIEPTPLSTCTPADILDTTEISKSSENKIDHDNAVPVIGNKPQIQTQHVSPPDQSSSCNSNSFSDCKSEDTDILKCNNTSLESEIPLEDQLD